MNRNFTGNERLGEVVASFPGAAGLFKRYKIDFCCGGDRILAAVLQEQGLEKDAILAELNQAYADQLQTPTNQTDWRTAPLDRLIDHIVNTHHGYLQRELPIISDLTTKVLRVHGGAHKELAKVHRLFHMLKLELEQHLITEEEVLFPLIKEYANKPSGELRDKALAVVDDIENEHDNAGDIIKELDELTGHYTVPADACASYRLVYQKLTELEADLFQHIHLENNILHRRLAENA